MDNDALEETVTRLAALLDAYAEAIIDRVHAEDAGFPADRTNLSRDFVREVLKITAGRPSSSV